MADPDASLKEIKRVLAPEGTLYVDKLPNRRSYLEAIARRLGLYYYGACDDKLYDVPEAVGLLRRQRFRRGRGPADERPADESYRGLGGPLGLSHLAGEPSTERDSGLGCDR